MIPVAFEGCAGWLYLPEKAAPLGRGVVLCDGFGYEALCTQRAMALLAGMLAEAGLPVLRFHYAGTGDSVGDAAPGQIDRWIGSIGAAADYLRQATGVAEIGLCGFRLGAVLAVEAARRRSDVAMLGLLAPILSGRRHARELTLAAALQETDGAAEWSLVQGYPLHRSDLARLRELEPRLGAGAAPRVLLLAAEAPSGPIDGTVEIRLFPELAGLVQETEAVTYPLAAFHALIGGFARDAPAGGPIPVIGDATLPLGDGIVERPLRFGPDDRCFGVLCRPARPVQSRGVLILNTGLNHHTGNGRGGVRLARRLAASGIVSLRVDAAGIGDSWPVDPVARVGFHDLSRIGDVRAALGVLQGEGCVDAVLTGICAGAYLGLHTAAVDQRIAAAVLVNLPYFHVEEEDPAVPLWRRGLHPRYWRPFGAAPGEAYAPAPRRAGYRRLEYFTTWLLGLPLAVEPVGRRRCLRFLRLWLTQCLLAPMRSLAPGRPAGMADRLLHNAWRRGTRLVLAYSARDPGLFELAACFGVGGARLARLGWAQQTMIDGADHVLTTAEMQARCAALIEAELGLPPAEATHEKSPAGSLRRG